jgi:hypothetical protein
MAREAMGEIGTTEAETGQETTAHVLGAPTQRAVSRRMETTRYAESVPLARRPLYLKVSVGEASPRQAIKAKCQECVGYEDVTAAIPACTVFKCPLWAYRPYQQGEAE